MLRIAFDELQAELKRFFVKLGFPDGKAELLARTLAENTLDGVASHGLNRVQMIARQIRERYVNISAEAQKITSFGAMERWDGNSGPGVINAHLCTDRVMQIAREQGIGCVALRNTNHWMRGGTYGWKAANAGFLFICWTNTKPNMPPWGGLEARLGNNPFVLAVPRKEGALVLDMAMTQFSYGKLETMEIRGETLPYHGGFDREGRLSKEPKAILESELGLPIGYWKGAGLALMLDLLAALLSSGRSTCDIGKHPDETRVSQVYIAFDLSQVAGTSTNDRIISETVRYVKSVRRMLPRAEVLYPGERALRTRAENLRRGIAVDEVRWRELCAM